MLLGAVLTAAFSAIGQQPRTDATTVSGVYSVTFNLNIASTLLADPTITCRSQIAPNASDSALSNPGHAVSLVAVVPVAAGPAVAAGLATR